MVKELGFRLCSASPICCLTKSVWPKQQRVCYADMRVSISTRIARQVVSSAYNRCSVRYCYHLCLSRDHMWYNIRAPVPREPASQHFDKSSNILCDAHQILQLLREKWFCFRGVNGCLGPELRQWIRCFFANYPFIFLVCNELEKPLYRNGSTFALCSSLRVLYMNHCI